MEIRKKNSLLLFLLISAVFIAVILYFSGAFKPKLFKTGNFKTSVADSGEIISSTSTTGIVAAENEVLILSPVACIIDKIIKEPGSMVKQGDVILKLNPGPVSDEIEKLIDQLEMKRNNLEKTQLNSQSTRLDLDYNEEVKKLRIASLNSQLADQKQLLEVGGISPAKIEETKQEIVLAEKDLSMMKEKNSIRLKQLVAEEKGLILQIRIDEKALEEKKELIDKMNITAPSSGIILAVLGQEGEKVNADKLLVRMSSLSSFKIIGSVEEQNANLVKTGNPVIVKIDDDQLDGIIGNIMPVVENNKIQFNIHLKNNNHPKLIANQKVEIQLINHRKENVLRINKFDGLEENRNNLVFIVKGDLAVKKEIQIGIIGDNYCEVISGLNEGDSIVLENANNYRNVDKIEINK